jgi:hypothetical protein
MGSFECREEAPDARSKVIVAGPRALCGTQHLFALINTGESSVVDDLIRFADPSDPYNAIGSVCSSDICGDKMQGCCGDRRLAAHAEEDGTVPHRSFHEGVPWWCGAFYFIECCW